MSMSDREIVGVESTPTPHREPNKYPTLWRVISRVGEDTRSEYVYALDELGAIIKAKRLWSKHND